MNKYFLLFILFLTIHPIFAMQKEIKKKYQQRKSLHQKYNHIQEELAQKKIEEKYHAYREKLRTQEKQRYHSDIVPPVWIDETTPLLSKTTDSLFNDGITGMISPIDQKTRLFIHDLIRHKKNLNHHYKELGSTPPLFCVLANEQFAPLITMMILQGVALDQCSFPPYSKALRTTPIHEVCRWNNAKNLLVMLEASAKTYPDITKLVNTIDDNGNTPLYIAAFHAAHNCVPILINYGARTGIRNKFKETPLHGLMSSNAKFVPKKHFNATLKLLYNADVKLQAKNNAGKTAIDIHTYNTQQRCFLSFSKSSSELLGKLIQNHRDFLQMRKMPTHFFSCLPLELINILAHMNANAQNFWENPSESTKKIESMY